nr:hypothetical protein GCM10020092_062550 [Actinoplanes digitatis]
MPFKDVALGGDAKRNPVIGVWTTTDRNRVQVTGQSNPKLTDDRVQVSRLGNPLVNEVVVPSEPEGRLQFDLARQGRRHPGRRQAGHRPRAAEADRGHLRRTRA